MKVYTITIKHNTGKKREVVYTTRKESKALNIAMQAIKEGDSVKVEIKDFESFDTALCNAIMDACKE